MWLIVLLMLVVACWRLLLVVGCAIGAFFACGGFGFNCGSVCFCVVFSRIVWVLFLVVLWLLVTCCWVSVYVGYC